MNKLKFLNVLLAALIVLSACKRNNSDDDDEIILQPEVIPSQITANKTLTSDRVWILKGYAYVSSNATLTIEAGTVIKSDVTEKGALIIDKGSKINAQGTADRPIVFTSGKPAGERMPGDWGGIIIIGDARTNRTSLGDCEGGINRQYGLGQNDSDNSGTMKYVRLEYAGIAHSQGSEINALTFYSVGSGTILENIMVAYAKDDAYEFFGGTVGGKNMIAFATSDDDFDFDYGYRGNIQFGLVLRHPDFVDATDAGNGIECDNEATIPGSGPSSPRTQPSLSNFTLIGTNGAAGEKEQHNFANRWRKATQFILNNSVLIGFKKGGFAMETAQTVSDYLAGTSQFKNNIVHAVVNPYLLNDASAQGASTNAAIKTKAEADGGVTLASATDAKLTSPFTFTAPNFLPATGSPALTGTWAATPGATQVTYRGAFGTSNWASGWTNWNPQATTY
jgi:hypothetical protein